MVKADCVVGEGVVDFFHAVDAEVAVVIKVGVSDVDGLFFEVVWGALGFFEGAGDEAAFMVGYVPRL